MRSSFVTLAMLSAVCAGCDTSFRADSGGNAGGGRQSQFVQVETADQAGAPAAQPAATAPAAPAAGQPAAAQSSTAQPSAAQPSAGQPAEAQPAAGTPPAGQPTGQTTLQPAQVGVGVKGQGYGGGLITEPIRVRFRVQEQLQFNQVTEALKLFEATEGRAPKSHEEFMERIIQANSIQLPELPPGQSYLYDPEKKELMVQRPR